MLRVAVVRMEQPQMPVVVVAVVVAVVVRQS